MRGALVLACHGEGERRSVDLRLNGRAEAAMT